MFELEIRLKNFKSFYGEECRINFEKPINLIVGLNDSGKSNLLQSIAFLLDEYFKKNKPIDLAVTSEYEWSVYDNNEKGFLLTEGEEDGLLRLKVKINRFPIFQVISFLERGKDPVAYDFPCIFVIDNSTKTGSFDVDRVIIIGDEAYHIDDKINKWVGERCQRNELIVRPPPKVENVKDHKEHLRSMGFKCICDKEPKPEKLEPESVEFLEAVLDKFRNLKPKFFDFVYLTPKTIHKFPSELRKKIEKANGELEGAAEMSKFLNKIREPIGVLKIGCIEDISLKESLFKDKHRGCNLPWFVAAEGVKKLSLLMYITYLCGLKSCKLINDSFVSIILVDEIEQGLHPPKQRAIVEKIKEYIKDKDIDIQKNVKLIISTHSPIVWKEFIKIYNKNPELIDIFYVFRSKEGYTKVCKKGGVETKEQEKVLELELGLSQYEMPRVVIFCEGPTDEEFLRGILEKEGEKGLGFDPGEIDIYQFGGATLPNTVKEIIKKQLEKGRPFSYTRKVLFVGDEDQEKNRKRKIKELEKIAKNFEIEDISFKPTNLEHFIFGKVEGDKQLENIRDKLNNLLEVCNNDDDKKEVSDLLKNVKPGGVDNYKRIKDNEQIYRIIGKYWREILLDKSQKETINKIINFIKNESNATSQ